MQEEEWLGGQWLHACAPEATPDSLNSVALVGIFALASGFAFLQMWPCNNRFEQCLAVDGTVPYCTCAVMTMHCRSVLYAFVVHGRYSSPSARQAWTAPHVQTSCSA